MRKWVLGVVALVALVLVVALVAPLDARPTPAAPPVATPTSHPEAKERLPARVPTPLPQGALRIRGVVLDDAGPVAGVRVSASRSEPEQTLSELPCPPWLRPSPGRLPQCLERATTYVAELIQAREGEAPVYAETTTAGDGTFVLGGLPEGVFALQALGEHGAVLRTGVRAGLDGVELRLDTGVTLEGVVTGEEQPLAGARVTAFSTRHTRFFDALTGPDGRFRIGPMPMGDHALAITAEGWHPGVFPSHLLSPQGGRFELFRSWRLTGRVESRQGEPIAGAEVHAVFAGTRRLNPPEQMVTSDEGGRFTFTALPAGDHMLSAVKDGASGDLRVSMGVERPLREVVLYLDKRFVSSVTGTVWNEAGRPIAGATVTLQAMVEGVWRWTQAVTGPDGRYELKHEWKPDSVSNIQFLVLAPRYLRLRKTADRLPAEPLDFTLTPSVVVEGTVVDTKGQPIAGIRLLLEPIPPRSGGADSAVSDAEGRFVLNASMPGDYRLTAAADEVRGEEVLSVRAPSEHRVVLRTGASVSGTVTDARGLPLDSVRLELRNLDAKGQPARNGTTNEQGHFALGGLKGGTYVLDASLQTESLLRRESRTLTLKNGERTEVSLRFEDGRALSGTVVDGTGEPVAGALVRASLPEEPLSSWQQGYVRADNAAGVRSGPEGRFTLRDLEAKAYVLMASKEGHTFAPARSRGGTWDGESLRVGAEAGEVQLVLERHGHIRGRILGPDGTPLTSFTLNGRPVKDAGGAFDLPFAKSGDVALSLVAEDLAPVLRLVPVRAGVDVDLGDLRMDGGRQIRGQVMDAETLTPIPWARVFATVPPEGAPTLGEPQGGTARTDMEGRFVLPNVEARPLTLVVGDDFHLERRVAVDARTEDVLVTLHRGARVEVTVRNARGEPQDATVHFARHAGGGRSSETRAGARGTTVERGLAPGLYTVHVQPQGGTLPASAFIPQQVHVPESGQVSLSFTEQTGGATLMVHAEAPPHTILLLPGVVPAPQRPGDLGWLSVNSIRAVWGRGNGVAFPHVPPGHATLFVLRYGPPARYHREELDLPSEGTVAHEVRLEWRGLELPSE